MWDYQARLRLNVPSSSLGIKAGEMNNYLLQKLNEENVSISRATATYLCVSYLEIYPDSGFGRAS